MADAMLGGVADDGDKITPIKISLHPHVRTNGSIAPTKSSLM